MLVLICGLAGAGKTTCLEILESLGGGAKVYVGSFITAEVIRRGMESTPESERVVREDLRAAHGMEAFAQLALPTIHGILEVGRVALVDAIYCAEEYDFYRQHCSSQVVRIAVDTARSERQKRLQTRLLRPIDSSSLDKRDEFELTKLGLADVMAAAEYKISNNGSLSDLDYTMKCLDNSLRITRTAIHRA